jgi:hypothetical protein
MCQWRDGSTNWANVKDMKHSYPVQVAEYAFANRIDDGTCFCLVGIAGIREAAASHNKSEVEVLSAHAQILNKDPQDGRAGTGV